MTLIITFTLITLVNVILTTIKSLATIKCGKTMASLTSALSQAFYILVVVYTVADFPMWQKMLITFGCYFVGVFLVKFVEEKLEKEKLWKIDTTIYSVDKEPMIKALEKIEIPFVYNEYGKHTMFSIFCNTRKETQQVAEIIKKYNGRYFITENRGVEL